MPARVSTGDQDAVLRQIRWCVAVQTLVNCHCKLEENPVGDVEPMQLVVQYLTQAAIKLPNAGNNTSAVRRLPSAARTVRDTGVRYSGLFCGSTQWPGTRYQTTCEIRHVSLPGAENFSFLVILITSVRRTRSHAIMRCYY